MLSGTNELPIEVEPTTSDNLRLCLKPGWICTPGNEASMYTPECLSTLYMLYMQGKRDKKHRVSAEKAHRILLETVLSSNWKEQVNVTVAKIKAFFQMTPHKIQRTMHLSRIDCEEVEEAELELINAEIIEDAQDLQDL